MLYYLQGKYRRKVVLPLSFRGNSAFSVFFVYTTKKNVIYKEMKNIVLFVLTKGKLLCVVGEFFSFLCFLGEFGFFCYLHGKEGNAHTENNIQRNKKKNIYNSICCN